MPYQTNTDDFTFNRDFDYSRTRSNPYEQKLSEDFAQIVYEGKTGEEFKGKWQSQVFQNDLPIHLEIGSGFGKFMTDYLQERNDLNFIGLEHRFKRSYQLLHKLKKLENQNYRFLRAKGERIGFLFEENEIDAMYYFFPDPWPKRRQHKKRLFQDNFLKLSQHILKPQAKLFIKTDHDDYFDWMLEHVEKFSGFKTILKSFDLHQDFPDHFLSLYKTKFEHIFLNQGIKIKAMVLENNK